MRINTHLYIELSLRLNSLSDRSLGFDIYIRQLPLHRIPCIKRKVPDKVTRRLKRNPAKIAESVKHLPTTANLEHQAIKEAVQLEHQIQARLSDIFEYQSREIWWETCQGLVEVFAVVLLTRCTNPDLGPHTQ